MELYYKYKPPQISDEEWVAWMWTYFTEAADPEVHKFNAWICSKVKSDILSKIVREVEIVRSRRKTGRYVRKRGLDPDDKKPDLVSSLGNYGALFFGSKLGYHREFSPLPGRKLGGIGSFCIIWDVSYRVSGDPEGTKKIKYSIKGEEKVETIRKQNFFNGLACVHALIEEAEHRGDHVTLLMGPRPFEKNMDNEFGTNYYHITDKTLMIDFKSTKNPKKILRANMNIFQGFWNQSIPYYDGVPNPVTDSTFEEAYKCDDKGWIDDSDDSGGVAQISPTFFWTDSTKYDEIKHSILSLIFEFGGVAYVPKIVMVGLEKLWGSLQKEKRGTVIIISKFDFPGFELQAWRQYQEFNKYADIFILDVGSKDHGYIYNHTNFKKNNKKIVHYIWVGDDVSKMTYKIMKAIGGQIEGVAVT